MNPELITAEKYQNMESEGMGYFSTAVWVQFCLQGALFLCLLPDFQLLWEEQLMMSPSQEKGFHPAETPFQGRY